MVLPKVGSKADKLLEDYIKPAKKAGYEVSLHFVDLSRNKALGRMLNRFIELGRFLDPALIEKYAPLKGESHIIQCYEVLKNSLFIGGYSKWDNDMGRGERPVLIEHKNLTGNYINHARTQKGGHDYGMEPQHDTGREGEIFSGDTERGYSNGRHFDEMGRNTQERTEASSNSRLVKDIRSSKQNQTQSRRTVSDERRATVSPVDIKPSLCEKLHRKNAEVIPPKRNSRNLLCCH